MTDNENSGNPPDNHERRNKKMRRLGKERRDQSRWSLDNPIRRKGPGGRRALDRLLNKPDTER
ncbi:MAG: hypothetical protein A3E57_06095 [Candidatus Muproteobacteria bacterium RIFCSPHIGHO2_12_FULL_60_33]|uniref:Uncharacterized protein n=1 Tax=Candidatus Muproteobacteria bacterium RIFCSPLOWO2_01_FULL_60_18 TaxID=1817768 RepID=A0A1F6U0L8_9PROT|nr:MAG: hypothetical protein A3A87_03305 [Candidatus Muproteobacteria bacterium RIFCSPLOWO2_01_FULL_60_18]OGI52437.1 MAG: hypothetical protein A2W42_01870 [Candidatus Muproteobacteria bacterium RIFCSPHIGHO2_01_60_12]OGI54723.1 MAG: hypothetical protein A3E57_06095 [Candidatus Muproteobacteria bacterium RIFCSPHIGHO2_12_FULL_60_33]OGI55569.1 MAG: hypothetical protein A3D32_05600 [Candidatus Muproteobacteria bacterium RIFCSPHIGHO2_02_FULL_60_13]OGI58923.1 MAG: hypothetical protein A2809_00155 [Can